MSEDEKCEQSSSLGTTLVSDTQAYGVMFSVRAKQEPLLVETLELSSVYVAGDREIHVEIFTKEGGYKSFEANPDAWVKIADTSLHPAKEGHGTLIPKRSFHPVEVKPYTERAFYVTLDTTDLRYANAPGSPMGSIYAQDENLQVHVGAGLLEYPFSNRIFEPRVFCGIIHYKKLVDCDNMAVMTSKVSYAFIVQHDGLSPNVVTSQVNSIVRGSIVSLLGSDLNLMNYKTSASLALESVDTIVSAAFCPETYSECMANTVRSCTAVVTEVRFAHTDNMSRGDLIYRLLRYRTQVTSNLNIGNSMDVGYVGFVPVETEMIVHLEGVPRDTKMNEKQTLYFEDTMQAFLGDKLGRIPSINILNVHVKNHQDSLIQRKLASGHRLLDDENPLTSTDVTTIVTASFKPPPFVDFNFEIEDMIDLQGDEYRDDLVNRRDLTLNLDDGNFFAQIEKVSARPVNGTDRNVASTKSKGPAPIPGWGIFLLVVFFLLLALLLCFLHWKRRGRVKYEKEDRPVERRKTEVVDDYVSQVYENAFRGFVDDQEAEIMLRKESDHEKKFGLFKAGSFKSSRNVQGTSVASQWNLENSDHQQIPQRRPQPDRGDDNRAHGVWVPAEQHRILSNMEPPAQQHHDANQRGLMSDTSDYSRRSIGPGGGDAVGRGAPINNDQLRVMQNAFEQMGSVSGSRRGSSSTREDTASTYSRSNSTRQSSEFAKGRPPQRDDDVSSIGLGASSAYQGMGASSTYSKSPPVRSAFDQSSQYSRSRLEQGNRAEDVSSVGMAALPVYSTRSAFEPTMRDTSNSMHDYSSSMRDTSSSMRDTSGSRASTRRSTGRRVSFQDTDDVSSVGRSTRYASDATTTTARSSRSAFSSTRSSDADEALTKASEHTAKQDNRSRGTSGGVDQEVLSAYMKDPKALL